MLKVSMKNTHLIRFFTVAILCILIFSPTTFSQTRVDLNFSEVELSEVFDYITRSFGVTFVYTGEISKRRVSIQLRNAELETALRFLSIAGNFDYIPVGHMTYVIVGRERKVPKLYFGEYIPKYRAAEELAKMVAELGVECFTNENQIIFPYLNEDARMQLVRLLQSLDSEQKNYKFVFRVIAISKGFITSNGQISRDVLTEALRSIAQTQKVKITYGFIDFKDSERTDDNTPLGSFQVSENFSIKICRSKETGAQMVRTVEIETDVEALSYKIDLAKTHKLEIVAESRNDFYLINLFVDKPEDSIIGDVRSTLIHKEDELAQKKIKEQGSAVSITYSPTQQLTVAFSSNSHIAAVSLDLANMTRLPELRYVQYLSRITDVMWFGFGYSLIPSEEIQLFLSEKLIFGPFVLIPKFSYGFHTKQLSFGLSVLATFKILDTFYFIFKYNYQKEISTNLELELGIKHGRGRIGFVLAVDSNMSTGFGLSIRW